MKYNEPLDGNPDDPYVDANPATGLAGSQVPAATLEYPQREIVAVISDSGQMPDNGDLTQLLQGIKLLIASRVSKGVVVGRFAYLSQTEVELQPVVESSVFVEVDGVPVIDAAVTFDITSDLEGGQSETASTFYYAYVEESGGALVPHLSETAPVTTGGKVGYHPTNTTWRYIGSVYNDASSNFLAFDAVRTPHGMEYRWRTSSPVVALGLSLATYTLKTASRVPATARALLAELNAASTPETSPAQSYLGDASLSGLSPSLTNCQVWSGKSNFANEGLARGWVTLNSSRQYVAATGGSPTLNNLYERGYREG